jgi:hypothetical protein
VVSGPLTEPHEAALHLLPRPATGEVSRTPAGEGAALLRPKYKLRAHRFAYVGSGSDPHTWSLPDCLESGAIGVRRLPKAIQAILSNYRGTKVSKIPEAAVPDVLVRPGRAAAALQLEAALDPLGRLAEVRA